MRGAEPEIDAAELVDGTTELELEGRAELVDRTKELELDGTTELEVVGIELELDGTAEFDVEGTAELVDGTKEPIFGGATELDIIIMELGFDDVAELEGRTNRLDVEDIDEFAESTVELVKRATELEFDADSELVRGAELATIVEGDMAAVEETNVEFTAIEVDVGPAEVKFVVGTELEVEVAKILVVMLADEESALDPMEAVDDCATKV